MEENRAIEERVQIRNGDLSLSGILTYPLAGRPRRAILLCSPHPHFAGNMENNVIQSLARYFAEDSVTLRFDYRGVGESDIDLPPGLSVFDYWTGVERDRDTSDALADVRAAGDMLSHAAPGLPPVVIGYSFGAAVGLLYGGRNDAVRCCVGVSPPLTRVDFDFLTESETPCRLLCGESDFVFSAESLDRIVAQSEGAVTAEVLTNSDHFFRGEEERLALCVENFIHAATNPSLEEHQHAIR